MADYRDLLRRAIEALPENNGNARRQVYDKARAALRKQLDAIQPELASREKTHHRLQLEECIREVEQEATERILSGLSRLEQDNFGPGIAAGHEIEPPSEDVDTDGEETEDENQETVNPFEEEAPNASGHASEVMDPASEPEDVPESEPVVELVKVREPQDAPYPEPSKPAESLADKAPVAVEPQIRPTEMPEDAPIPEATPSPEPISADRSGPRAQSLPDRPPGPEARTYQKPVIIPVTAAETVLVKAVAAQNDSGRVGAAAALVLDAADNKSVPEKKFNPLLARFSSKTTATTPETDGSPKAMAVEREVDLDAEDGDPQTAIDHAIAVLDREASGGDALAAATIETADPETADLGFARAEAEDEGGGGSPALTIFLVLVLLLLAGAGGASYWAWREGYLDLSSFFGESRVAVVSDTSPATTDASPDAPPAQGTTTTPPAPETGTETSEASRPGNTVATPGVVETPATGLEQADQNGATGSGNALALAPTDNGTTIAQTMDGTSGVGNTVTPGSTEAADAATAVAEPNAEDDKTDIRLPGADDPGSAPADTTSQAAVSPDAMSDGSQSLLLEASDQANAGAVPFSGTVDWTRGVDELGQPTLLAAASIPARNMNVDVLIRKNSDPSLPASHLVEINFTVSDSFIGGGISRIAGILMKNEELVQGVPLVGASARVVGNNFLFALSAATQDIASNSELLKSRKWMDLALIYSTGKQAILTFEKDAAATALFNEVMAVWNPASATTDTPPATPQ